MNLFKEFIPYMDGDGLVCPKQVQTDDVRVSNNSLMYTSEMMVLLEKSKELTPKIIEYYKDRLQECITAEGMLNRFPNDYAGQLQQGPDDYYGVLNACIQLDMRDEPKKFLKALIWYAGFLNNVNPGKPTLSSFLARQPQLIACLVTGSFSSLINPLHYLIRALFFPFYLYSAVIVSTSGIFSPVTEIDNRRLTWHLVQSLKNYSLLCHLASNLWYSRLFRQYGPEGMKVAVSNYYEKGHPLTKYWVN